MAGVGGRDGDGMGTLVLLPSKFPKVSQGGPEATTSCHLLIPTACCEEPHLKVTSQTHPNLPHSSREGCLRSGGLASLGAGPLTLHSMDCSMGEGERRKRTDSELHSDIYGARPMVGGRTDTPASAQGLSPAKRPLLGPKRHRGWLKQKNSQSKKN